MTKLYCIEDKKAGAVVCFFPSATDQTAERSFIDLLSKTEEDVFNQHPEDFCLVHLLDVEIDDNGLKPKFGGEIIRHGSDYSKPYLEGLRLARQKFLEKLASERTIGGSADERT